MLADTLEISFALCPPPPTDFPGVICSLISKFSLNITMFLKQFFIPLWKDQETMSFMSTVKVGSTVTVKNQTY